MCVIMYSPVNRVMPNKKIIEAMYEANSHGMGIMLRTRDGILYYEKAIFSLEKLHKRLKSFDKSFNLVKCDVAIHFRIATSGGINAPMTHPFQVVDSVASYARLQGSTDKPLIMHNGIMFNIGDHTGISDTAHLASNILPKKDMELDKIPDILYPYGRTQKFLIFSKQGIVRTGEWYEQLGVFYSNLSWEYYFLTSHEKGSTLDIGGSLRAKFVTFDVPYVATKTEILENDDKTFIEVDPISFEISIDGYFVGVADAFLIKGQWQKVSKIDINKYLV